MVDDDVVGVSELLVDGVTDDPDAPTMGRAMSGALRFREVQRLTMPLVWIAIGVIAVFGWSVFCRLLLGRRGLRRWPGRSLRYVSSVTRS